MNLGGSLMRQMERQMPLDSQSPHVINMGKLVEEHENKIRHTLNEIYFGKSRDIVHGLRYAQGHLWSFWPYCSDRSRRWRMNRQNERWQKNSRKKSPKNRLNIACGTFSPRVTWHKQFFTWIYFSSSPFSAINLDWNYIKIFPSILLSIIECVSFWFPNGSFWILLKFSP